MLRNSDVGTEDIENNLIFTCYDYAIRLYWHELRKEKIF